MSNIDKFVEDVFSDEKNCAVALDPSNYDAYHFNDVCEWSFISMALVDKRSYEDLEDSGSVWSVYELNFNNGQEVKYIKFTGYYSSYIGVNYHNHTYVTPKTVKSIVWE